MDKKITNAIYALYGGALTSLAIAAQQYLELRKLQSEIDLGPGALTAFNYSLPVFPILILVATYFVARDLKEKKKWSWTSALTLLLIDATGISVLFSIFGGIQLLDREVREYFLKKMEIDLS